MAGRRTTENLLTGEELQLLSNLSNNDDFIRSLNLFYSGAMVVFLMPIWFYWRILIGETPSVLPIFLFIMLGGSYVIVFGYLILTLIQKVAYEKQKAMLIEIYKKYVNDKKVGKIDKLRE